MQGLTAEEILKGLTDRDTKVLDYIYENFFHQTKIFINQNSGSEEDAQDIYQDAILIIYQKARNENLTLNCSFSTYLFSVCRLLWLKQLKERKRKKLYIEDSGKFVELDEGITELFEYNEKQKLFQDHFKKLSYNCQKILELFLARISLKEIANILSYKSEGYVKKRKSKCKDKLVDNIKSDPEFKNIV